MLHYLKKTILFVFILFVSQTYSQKTNWNVDPIDRTFVKNAGQYGLVEGEEVLFYTRLETLNILFTESSIFFEHQVFCRDFDWEATQTKKTKYLCMETQEYKFLESNKSVTIDSINKQEGYHLFTNLPNLRASTFERITYRGIYDNIDIEFYLPKEGGLKYNLIVHPGGDLDQVRIKLKDGTKIGKDKAGNLLFGNTEYSLKDKAPIAYLVETNKKIRIEYNIDKTIISFKTRGYDKKSTLFIDPWLNSLPILPNFTTVGSTVPITPITEFYDLDFDFNGNVFGRVIRNAADFTVYTPRVKKYNNSGVLQWTFNARTVDFFNSWGDVTVNKFTGSSYFVSTHPYTDKALISRLNSGGLLLDTFYHSAIPDTNSLYELLRLHYDHCGNKLVVSLGAPDTSNLFQLAFSDTVLSANIDGANVVGITTNFIDAVAMAADPKGDAMYQLLEDGADNTGVNTLFKSSILGARPPSAPIWQVANVKTDIGETAIKYLPPLFPLSLGVFFAFNPLNQHNSLSCGMSYVYVFNGDSLTQWDKNTGARINQTKVITAPSSPSTEMGGVRVDKCGRVFVANYGQIDVYDENLTLLTSLPVSGGDTINDIVLAEPNLLYVAGNQFLEQIDYSTNTALSFSFNITPDSCGLCIGSATILGCSDIDSLSILWTPSGETTPTATNLCAGWNYVRLTGGCLPEEGYFYDSVFIPLSTITCDLSVSLANDTICLGECDTLLALTQGEKGPVSFVWNNGITSTTANAVVCPLITTTYQVIATDSAGFIDTAVAVITVLPTPVFNLGNDTTLCFDSSFTISSGISGVRYLWNTGDTSATINVTTTGTYWLTVDNGGCTYSDTINVALLFVGLDLGKDTVICNSPSFTIDATTPGFTYIWDDGSTNSTRTVTSNGSYSVTVTNTICTYSDTIEVVIINIGVNLINDTTLCPNDSILLTSALTGATPTNYLWNTGATTPIITGNTQQSYWLEVDSLGCKARDTFNLFYTNLSIDFGNDTTLCQGDSLTLDAQNSGASYLWNDGSSNQRLTVTSNGTYYVTVSNFGCTFTDTIAIDFQTVTASFSGAPISGCIPLFVSFMDNSLVSSGSILSWNWNFGDGNSSNLQNPNNTYTTPGNFTVSLGVTTNNGCSDNTSINTYINPFPKAKAEFAFNPTKGEVNKTINFNNLSTNSTSWKWFFGDGDSSIIENPTHLYKAKGTYTIVLIALSSNGCNDTIEYQLSISNTTVIYAPNAFTPDEDNINDNWKLYGIEDYLNFKLLIFNRWGEVVFESNDPTEAWDGTYGGEKVQIGVYVWRSVINIEAGETVELNGHITLIR